MKASYARQIAKSVDPFKLSPTEVQELDKIYVKIEEAARLGKFHMYYDSPIKNSRIKRELKKKVYKVSFIADYYRGYYISWYPSFWSFLNNLPSPK